MQIQLTLTITYDAENELLDHEISHATEELLESILETNELPKTYESTEGVVVNLESIDTYGAVEIG
jgi:hypothetical protein